MGRSYVFSDRAPRLSSSATPIATFRPSGCHAGSTAGSGAENRSIPPDASRGAGAGVEDDDALPGTPSNEHTHREHDDEDDRESASSITPFGSPRSATPDASDDEVEEGAWATANAVDEVDDVEAGSGPFRTREEFYATLMMCGQAGFTERGYSIMRAFYNAGRPSDAHLPHVTTVRRRIIPRALRRFGLSRSVAPGGVFAFILPSVHARRDFSFRATYDKFFRAEQRDELLREREPEFYDTAFFQDRARVLMTCPQLTHFSLAGYDFWLGAIVDICLVGDTVVHQTCIANACYAGAELGVGRDNGIHAGDLVINCSDATGVAMGQLACRHWRPAGLDAMVWFASAAGGPVKAKAVYPSVVVASSLTAYGADATGAGKAPYPSLSASTRRTVRGMGADGIPTVTACVSIYGDGCRSREGRNTSVESWCMFWNGWMVEDRVSRHAARLLAVTPPGVDGDEILRLIEADMAEGATCGWVVADPDGNAVRVLLDVCFFVGDYVQVSKSSHLRGHNGVAPCSLCGYHKPGGAGIQYGGGGSAADAALARTTSRTAAVLEAVRALNE